MTHARHLCGSCVDLNCKTPGLTCEGGPAADQCTTCKNDSEAGLKYLNIKMCVSVCPSDKYPNTTTPHNLLCSLCNESCLTCNDSLDSNCTSCPTNFVLDDGHCNLQCADGKYADVNRICQLCDPICQTCSISSDRCTSCNSTLGLTLD